MVKPCKSVSTIGSRDSSDIKSLGRYTCQYTTSENKTIKYKYIHNVIYTNILHKHLEAGSEHHILPTIKRILSYNNDGININFQTKA